MTTRDGDTEAAAQPGPQCRRAAIGIDGQQRQFVRADVGSVDAGRGLDDAQFVLGDQRAAFAGQYADGLVVDKLAAQRVPLLGVFGRGHQPAFALGHHLAGDHHYVAVAQPGRGGGQRRAEVVAGTELGKPGDGQDLDRRRGAVLATGRHAATPARSKPALTISAVAFGSVISSGTERTAIPSMSAWSPSWTSQQSRMPVPARAP